LIPADGGIGVGICHKIGYLTPMQSMTETYSVLPAYRSAATTLLVAGLGLPICIALLGGPDLLGVVVGISALLCLTVVTYRRLRDAALSGGWIALFLLSINIGPSWDAPGPIHFYLFNLVALVPILMAWFAPTDFGANPRTNRKGQAWASGSRSPIS
jgi:uncharacterized membrane protein YhaH (DUF805 family)